MSGGNSVSEFPINPLPLTMSSVSSFVPQMQHTVPLQQQSPLPHYVSQVAVSVSITDVAITFGRIRQVIELSTGVPAAQPTLEWMFTTTLSLPCAVLLRDSLSEAIKVYEEKYGAVPADPNVRAGT